MKRGEIGPLPLAAGLRRILRAVERWSAEDGFELLGRVLAGDERADVAYGFEPYEPAEVELVLIILWEAQQRGAGWDEAWFTALRNIAPPRTCSPEVRAAVDEARAAIHEVKPYLRAAYERGDVLEAEVEKVIATTERRMRRLLPERKRRRAVA